MAKTATHTSVRPRPTAKSVVSIPLTPPDARLAVSTLSAEAQLAYDRLSQEERLSQVTLTNLVGEARPGDMLAELSAAWLAVEVPGGLDTRAGRAGYIVPAAWVPAAGLLDVEAAARQPSGRSGLLGVFARALDMDRAVTARGDAGHGDPEAGAKRAGWGDVRVPRACSGLGARLGDSGLPAE